MVSTVPSAFLVLINPVWIVAPDMTDVTHACLDPSLTKHLSARHVIPLDSVNLAMLQEFVIAACLGSVSTLTSTCAKHAKILRDALYVTTASALLASRGTFWMIKVLVRSALIT
jgi:hypothetical protein